MVEGVGLGRDHHFILPKQSKPTTVLHTRHNQHWGKLEICFNGLNLTYCQFCFHKKQNCGSFFSYQIGKYLNCSVVPKPSAVPVHDDHGVRRGWEAAAAVGIVGLVSSAKTLCRLFFSFSVLEPYLCLWSHSTLLVPTRVNELVVLSFFFSLHWVTWPSLVSCLSMLYNIGTVKKVICWYIWTHKVWVWAVMGLAGLFRCRVGFHGVWFQGVRFWWRLLRDLWRKSVYVSPLNPGFAAFAGVCIYCASKIGVVSYVAQSQPWSFRDLWVPWRHRSCRRWYVPWRAVLGTPWTTWFCLETCAKPFSVWPTLRGSFVRMRASVCIVTHSTALEAHFDEPLVLVCHLDSVAFRTYHLTTSSYWFLSGISTWIRRKRAWSDMSALQSTSTTRPIPRPISSPASSLMRSKGKPYTWTHIGKLVYRTDLAVKPFSHLCNTNIFFSKLHGPLSHTHCSWLSNENLNWNRPSPTSTIFRLLPIFHTDCRRFFAALALNGRVVMNFPMRLREYSSRISSLRVVWMVIGSSSSDVNEMFWIHSILSLKGNWCKFEFTTAREQTNYNRDDKSTINSFLDFQINTPITIEMINLKLTNF